MELLRALGTLTERPDTSTPTISAALGLPSPSTAEWHTTFVQTFYPYGSVYLGAQGFVGGEVRSAAAGLFDVLGIDVADDADHLAVLLDGLAGAHERSWTPATSTLLWEHLLPWTLPYLDRVAVDGSGPYRAWASLLTQVLMALTEQIAPPSGAALPLIGPDTGLPDPREHDSDDLVPAVLAPARFGAILTRNDLLAAADDLVLAPRMGERRYLLRALLQQDPVGTLAWLADHAAHAAARTERWPDTVVHLAASWAARATASADLLGTLSRAATDLQRAS